MGNPLPEFAFSPNYIDSQKKVVQFSFARNFNDGYDFSLARFCNKILSTGGWINKEIASSSVFRITQIVFK
jgi:hypothetical protein